MSNRLYGPSGAPGTAGLLALNTAGATLPVLPAKQTVTVNTETVILNPALASATQALVLSIPPGTQLEQRKFKVIASGYVTGGTTTNVTIKLYNGSSTTVGSDGTALGSTGAVAVNSTSAPFAIQAELQYDSVSGKMQGTFKSSLNNTLVVEVAVGATYTGINNANNPVANFVLSVTFSAANAGNIINVQEFGIYES